MGFDRPKSLGSNETGGGLSLPIWINFMSRALNGVPETPRAVPAGVVNVDGDWTVPEFTNRASYTSLMD
jgi:penicillin-binding protein 1A